MSRLANALKSIWYGVIPPIIDTSNIYIYMHFIYVYAYFTYEKKKKLYNMRYDKLEKKLYDFQFNNYEYFTYFD